ncbi:MAG: hypothetical protein HC830_04180 [Bacteroidetes bacterium]|nr:hypothetical protein [Bacteroidales bacterium]NJO68568.1 hypothetical protein [Bacteroidota bacterium]
MRLYLLEKNGLVRSVNEYWKVKPEKNFRELNNLPPAIVTGKPVKKGMKNTVQFQVSNTSKVPAIALKLNIKNAMTNEIILPAYFSDGYFTLMPGESRIVSVEYNSAEPVKITAEGYNIKESDLIKL